MSSKTRTALVTGGAGGIGAAICRRLATDGLRVAVVDRDGEAAAAVAAALSGRGHMGHASDATVEAEAPVTFDAIERQLGKVSVLVSGAGILMLRPDGSRNLIAETNAAEWLSTQDINVSGTFWYVREFARRLDADVIDGRVVTISSVAAQLGGYRSSASYIASKAAIIGLTKALARELGGHRVTVNSVAPGLIDAPMLRLSLDPADDAKASAAIPLGRLGTPEDVAGAVSFLVSQDASYITGSTIDVNGGYRMQ